MAVSRHERQERRKQDGNEDMKKTRTFMKSAGQKGNFIKREKLFRQNRQMKEMRKSKVTNVSRERQKRHTREMRETKATKEKDQMGK